MPFDYIYNIFILLLTVSMMNNARINRNSDIFKREKLRNYTFFCVFRNCEHLHTHLLHFSKDHDMIDMAKRMIF